MPFSGVKSCLYLLIISADVVGVLLYFQIHIKCLYGSAGKCFCPVCLDILKAISHLSTGLVVGATLVKVYIRSCLHTWPSTILVHSCNPNHTVVKWSTVSQAGHIQKMFQCCAH